LKISYLCWAYSTFDGIQTGASASVVHVPPEERAYRNISIEGRYAHVVYVGIVMMLEKQLSDRLRGLVAGGKPPVLRG